MSWVFPKCRHTCPYPRKAEEDFTQTHGGEGDVTTEAENRAMWPQAKDCWPHQKLEEAWNGSSSGARGESPTLISPHPRTHLDSGPVRLVWAFL